MQKQNGTEGVAQRVTDVLRIRGVSGRKLARDLGLSAPYIARRLAGQVEFSESDIRIVADYLGVSPAALLDPNVEAAA